MGRCPDRSSGDVLLAAATAVSIAIAQGKTTDEIAVLAAFFNVLGESLDFLALHAPEAISSQTQTSLNTNFNQNL